MLNINYARLLDDLGNVFSQKQQKYSQIHFSVRQEYSCNQAALSVAPEKEGNWGLLTGVY